MVNNHTTNQADAQASTLNLALGNLGGVPKSWMTPNQSASSRGGRRISARATSSSTQRPTPRAPHHEISSTTNSPAERSRPLSTGSTSRAQGSTATTLKRPAATDDPPAEKRTPTESAFRQSPATTANTTNSQLAMMRQILPTQVHPQPHSMVPRPPPHQSHTSRPTSQQVFQQVFPQNTQHFQTPTYIGPQDHSIPPQIQPQSPASQAILPPGIPTLGPNGNPEFLKKLNDFQKQHRLPEALSHRFNYLYAAAEQGDGEFLLLHQYFCLLSEGRPNHFYQLPRDLREDAENVKQLMKEVLDCSNSDLPDHVLDFFTVFPIPWRTLEEISPQRHKQDVQNLKILKLKSKHFKELKRACQGRKFPPLMRNLYHDLGIKSPIFQRLTFLRVFRCVWDTEQLPLQQISRAGQEALNMFVRHQNDYIQMNGSSPHFKPTPEYAQWEGLWSSTFLELLNQHHREARAVQRFVAYSSPQQQQNTRLVQNSASHTPAIVHQMEPPRAQSISSDPRHRNMQQMPAQSPLPAQAYVVLPRGQTRDINANPNPLVSAMHQAGLRSPIPRVKSLIQPGDHSLYRYVKGFVKSPSQLADNGVQIEKWTFTISPGQIQSLPKLTGGSSGEPLTRILDEGSQIFRLRCGKWNKSELPNEHEWAANDTSWIPHSSFALNGTTLELRKKRHYGRDLSIDITGLLKEGDNTLQIAVLRAPDDKEYLKYLLAIEIVGVTTHTAITESCLEKNFIHANQTINRIKHKLTASTDDDDDLVVLGSSCTIDVGCAFTKKIWTIPARGAACIHYECFDLETFLQSRKREGDFVVPDHWQCPYCNKDARPHHLTVDGFLMSVRDQLANQGLLETESIIVAEDGTWKPRSAVDEHKGPRPLARSADSSHPIKHTSTPSAVEIIDLSD